MAYIGKGLDNGVRNRFIFAATQGQKIFTGSDLDGKTLTISDALYCDVYHNGVKIKLTTDWSSSTTTMTLVTGASVNDVIEIISFEVFGIPDTISASSGGTFNGGITATAGTFTGAVSGTTGTFSTSVATTKLDVNIDTNARLQSATNISEVGSGVFALQVGNQAESALKPMGFRAEDIRFATGNAIRARVTDNGITFNADTAAANALDDYEEGTFTPSDASGASLTLTDVFGLYTKIGRSVIFSLQVVYPSQANGNHAVVTGLPFASNNSSDASFTAVSKAGNGGEFDPLVYKNTVYLRFYNFAGASKTNANFDGKYLHISGSYQTA